MGIRRFIERFRGKQETVVQEPEYLTALPAPTDGDYPLRDKQENRLYRALCQRGRHILLYGPGGTGKTHMARKLFYRLSREYPRLAWVEYGTGIRHSMTRSQEEARGNPEQWFDQFIRKLEETERDTILFIDDAKEDAMDDAALAQITGMGITILMTSRCPEISPYETWELEPVSAGACADLFYAHYLKDPKQKYRPVVQALADRVERNVFAVRLLAAVTEEPVDLPRMMEALEEGCLMDHIGQLMNFSGLTDSQREILRCLSLMPESEMLEDLVRWFAFQVGEVEILVEKGWLVQNRETKSMVLHDLVREYCNRENPSRRTLETFFKGVLGENFNKGVASHASPTFKGKVLELQMRAIILMEMFWDVSDDLARAYNNMGTEFSKFGSYRNALEYYQKGLKLWEEVLPGDHPNLATAYNNVGTAYGDLGDHVKALEYKLKDLAICEKVLPSDHPDLAISYNNIGTTYGDLGDHEKALEYKLKDLAICEKVFPDDHPDLATSYNNVGTTYGDLGDHEKALEYKLKGLAICEKILPRNHPDLAAFYNNVGMTYGDLGDHEKALEYNFRSLAICKKVLPGDHPDLATLYNNAGTIYCYLGDHQKALEYEQKALVIREKVLPPHHPDIARSCNNIAKTYDEMEQYETALEWAHRGLSVAQQSLQEDHPTLKKYRGFVEYLEQKTKK